MTTAHPIGPHPVSHGAVLTPPDRVPPLAVRTVAAGATAATNADSAQESSGSNTEQVPPSAQRTGTQDFSSWAWWWQLNREPYMDLRNQLGGRTSPSSEAIFLGKGAPTQHVSWGDRPSAKTVRDDVLPALTKALESTSSKNVVNACLIALARIGEDRSAHDRGKLFEQIRPFLSDTDQVVAEAATAALGILGNESAVLLLSEILLDTSYGQKSVRRRRVRPRLRAYAAYALGLLGASTEKEDVRRYIVFKLASALENDDTATPDLGVACVTALGSTPLQWASKSTLKASERTTPVSSSRNAQILFLLRLLGNKGVQRQVRAYVPTALGHLLAVESEQHAGDVHTSGREELRERVGRELIARMSPRKREPVEVRRSCALAFGLIGDNDADAIDRDIRSALRRRDSDEYVRHWSLLSLGRIGGRDGHGPATGTREVREFLLRSLAKKGTGEAEWAALGLGLLERGCRRSGEPLSQETLDQLLRRLRKTSNPREIGAFAIALALYGAPEAEEVLAKKLAQVEEEEARAYTALALGCLRARTRMELVRRVLEKSTTRPLLLRESATASALLGDRGVVQLLVDLLRESRSRTTQAGLAQALGRLGDAAALPPLIAMLGDQTATEMSRAFAAVALGWIADRDALPWNTVLSLDANYATAPATLLDFEGFGILNIL